VANQDLWERLLGLVLGSGRAVRFSWVKGHSGNEMNDRVDVLAVEAATSQRGVAGEHFVA
jgi:ribonuclease HI